MPIDQWLDLLFRPLAWIRSTTDNLLPSGASSNPTSGWTAAITMALGASAVAFFIMALTSFALFEVITRFDQLIERVFLWSIRGSSLEVARSVAHRYASVASVLTRLRRLTGVRTYGRPQSAPQLPYTPADLKRRGLRGLTRFVLAIPSGIRAAITHIWAWFSLPIGLYLATGSAWVYLRPPVSDFISNLWAWLNPLVSPAAIPVASVAIAAGALALNHGLTTRHRARNMFLRDQAKEGERLLAEMWRASDGVVGSLDKAIDQFATALPRVLDSALRAGSSGELFLRDGVVVKMRATSQTRLASPGLRDADWDSKSPLKHFRTTSQNAWEPTAGLNDIWSGLQEIAVGGLDLDAAWRQAPAGARPLLWELKAPTPHTACASLSRARLESVGKRLLEATKREMELSGSLEGDPQATAKILRRCQNMVDSAQSEAGTTIWDALELREAILMFRRTVSNRHAPRNSVLAFLTRAG